MSRAGKFQNVQIPWEVILVGQEEDFKDTALRLIIRAPGTMFCKSMDQELTLLADVSRNSYV